MWFPETKNAWFKSPQPEITPHPNEELVPRGHKAIVDNALATAHSCGGDAPEAFTLLTTNGITSHPTDQIVSFAGPEKEVRVDSRRMASAESDSGG